MTLHALSPLDGRYANQVSPLGDFFSEFAFLRARVKVEVEFLSALSRTGLFATEALSSDKSNLQNFTEEDAHKIQKYEESTRHDVKAIEYFLRERLAGKVHRVVIRTLAARLRQA